MVRNVLSYHQFPQPGKISITPTKPCATAADLSLAYTPGVALPCLEIQKSPSDAYKYTNKPNLVAVITNGTAVLGLGNIGPLASKPVMEGKAVLFKRFADIDAFDIEISELNPERLVEIITSLAPTFGGINLEDIKAPECFFIEKELMTRLSIPVFHDDQHGTAVIVTAALLNALELTQRKISNLKIVFSGAGAAAIACAHLFLEIGIKKEQIILVDSKGVVSNRRVSSGLNSEKSFFAQSSSAMTLAEALVGADIFIGVSQADIVTKEMLKSMNSKPIIFALANPDPEIPYPDAKEAVPDGIIATGRSDYPNQVNNVLGFPFIFRGALDVGATKITTGMKLAAVKALAALAKSKVPPEVIQAYGQEFIFGADYIIPKPFDPRLLSTIAPAVADAAMASGVAQRPLADRAAYTYQLEKTARKLADTYSFPNS